MFQSLSGSDSLAWVKGNHGHSEIQLVLGEAAENLLGVLHSEFREGRFKVGQFADPWPGLFGWRAMELEDLENLIDLRIAHEEWSFLDEFGENAADGPHVNAKGVFPLAE